MRIYRGSVSMPVRICGVQQDPCRTSRIDGSLLSGVSHRTSLPSGSGIPARNMAASVSSAILPPPSGIKKALGNRFLKALSFYFPHLNSIILPYCISIAFTANFQESRFFSASHHGAGTLSSYSCSALWRSAPISPSADTSLPK